jgi:HAD superfamily hydrolase (TIGR01548 family)
LTPKKIKKNKNQKENLPARWPSVIIFDVDGVLVNVAGSFHRTTLETVKFFTGKKVTRAQLNQWKNRPGFNDDWKLSTAWVQSLGGKHEYDEVKAKFVDLYWGIKGAGYVNDEKWLLPRAVLRRLAKRSQLAIFTGRTKREMDYTLARIPLGEFFSHVITVEDVERPKPDPGGLLKILAGRDPGTAVYVGDNVDDANAAKSAHVPFVGILHRGGKDRLQRATILKELGALAILQDIKDLEAWLRRDPKHS